MSGYACPMLSWRYTYGLIPQVHGTPTTKLGAEEDGNSATWTSITGTKLSNAIRIVNGNTTGCYAWGTSTTACPTNGRNDAASADGLARKVLVIMTDGFSQSRYRGPSLRLPDLHDDQDAGQKLFGPDLLGQGSDRPGRPAEARPG